VKPHSRGVALCVASACGFGATAIFAKQAYAAGFGIATLLSLRLSLAAAAFWALHALRGRPRPPRRVLVAGLAIGALVYAPQAGLYFGALARIDASLAALLVYTYPALVVAGALALGREHASPSRLGALGLASAGAALVLVGGGIGGVDGVGVAMALATAVVYAAYILLADGALGEADPFDLSALVMTGAAASTVAFTLATGGPHLGVDAAGWGWLACLTLLSTVVPVSAFLAGLPLVGPATASIVSTAEPVVTVTLAAAVLGEALRPAELAGGALVLGAVVVLQRRGGTVPRDDAAARTSAPSPARTLAGEPA
jgi:drug/metabolite transporter (DMT)-like permease